MSFDKDKIHELYPEAENLMIEPMLVWKLPSNKESMLSEVCSNGEYFLEEKIDGAYYQFVKTENHSYLFGRTVSKLSGILTEKSDNVPHLKEALSCLPAGTILIGEIYVPGGTSKDTVSIMGCLPTLAIKRQEKEPIHYYVHDIIAYDTVNLIDSPADLRYKILAAIWEKHNLNQYSFLRLATRVDEDMEAEISRILKFGGEGAVLKKKDYPYTPGKRPAWSTIKVKQMDSIDLICTGFCDATKEYTGKELATWEYWEERGEQSQDGEYTWLLSEGRYYEDYLHNPHIYRPVTKPYFLGWKTAIRIGAYNDKGELVDLGTVSSGLTDDNKREMTENPDLWLGHVVALDCMQIDKKEHTLRHPVFKCKREDKDAKDCVISEIFC
nr:MAG TPA: ATP-dependent DNA ligase [Caudoviricetes sp.]